MAYLIKEFCVNEDTGHVSSYVHANIYETKALAKHLASKLDSDGIDVELADNDVYIKAPKANDDFSNEGNSVYYGCPEHQMFGDAWLYADCAGAW